MAGGKGERLQPLTQDRAKPAVQFGGIYRIIDFTLSNCINSGIRRTNVLTQYKSISLARHIKLGWTFLPSRLNEFVDVIPAQMRYGEIWYRGTADAIYQNIYTIQREDPSRVLILAGDHVYKMDYSRMLEFHLDKGAEVTIGVVEQPLAESRHLGVLQADKSERITEFREKPKEVSGLQGKPGFVCVSMGIYIFEKSVLFEELIPRAQKEEGHDFGRDILPSIVQERKVYAYRFVDENRRENPYWRDIGTLDAYYDANMDLVSVNPEFNLYDERWPINTYQPQFPPAKTVFADSGPNARRGETLDSLLSSGCIISGGKVVRSILSSRVRINSYARVEDSVLGEGVDVGRYARIRRAIIDKYVQIEPGTEIGYNLEKDRQRFTVTDQGVVVIPKGRVIGPEDDRPMWIDPVTEHWN
jgi:glucose-1-phosphate adenylyltransferase